MSGSAASRSPTTTAPASIPASAAGRRVRAFGGYQPGLDGMRGIGIITVLLYHANTRWLVGSFVNVSQFFTISGFLITAILLGEQSGSGIDLRRYWTRRFRRLMPAALLGLALAAVFGAFAADRHQSENLTGEVFAAATYWVNWKFILANTGYVDQFSSPSPVQHYWSLAIEEQFYLLLPLIMIVVHRFRGALGTLAVVIGAATVASAWWTVHLHDGGASFDRIYFGTDTRIVEILVGSMLAILLTRTGSDFSERTRTAIGVVGSFVFLGSLVVWWKIPIDSPRFWGGGQLPFAMSSAFLVLTVLADRGPVPWLYRRALFCWLGRLTYGIYIFHWPIYLWLTPDRTGLDTIPLLVVRVAITMTLAVLSFRYIEEPIRKRGLPGLGSWRVLAAPVAMVLVVGLTAAIHRRDAPDPLATLREDGFESPIVPADGVLDVLLLVDHADDPVVERIRELDDEKDDVSITIDRFRCEQISNDEGMPVCDTWHERWPTLVADVDPDTILIYTEGWPLEELASLAGDPEAGTDTAVALLDDGIDLLAAGGSRVVLSSPGVDFGQAILRRTEPFVEASMRLANDRIDVRRIPLMPDPSEMSTTEWIDRSARTLLTNASLYQRVDGTTGERVLVLGDSQARSLGYGLERWGAATGTATVWNAATEGCGLFVAGFTVDDRGGEHEPDDACTDAARQWAPQVDQFEPDVVIVLSSLWDLETRRLEGWTESRTVGDPVFDEALLGTYRDAVDTFTARGARVIWIEPPCIGAMDEFGSLEADERHQPALERLRAILEELTDDPAVTLFDLDEILCPGDSFRSTIDGIEKIRSDGVHFSVEGSLWFAEQYGDQLLSS